MINDWEALVREACSISQLVSFLSILYYLFVLFKPSTLESLRSQSTSLRPHMDIFGALGCMNQMGNVGCTGLGDQEPRV